MIIYNGIRKSKFPPPRTKGWKKKGGQWNISELPVCYIFRKYREKKFILSESMNVLRMIDCPALWEIRKAEYDVN